MNDKAIKNLLKALKGKSKPQGYDTTATVTRVEGSTCWVHIPGGVAETPCKLSIDAKEGDTVQVRVAGGKAHLTGNVTAPPTDDSTAEKAVESSLYAQSMASAAQTAVSSVKATAEEAAETATAAETVANATANYFFHDSSGAHVASTSGNANSGMNTLITSNGFAIRDGATTLAAWSDDAIEFYDSSRNALATFGEDGLTITSSGNDIAHLGYGNSVGDDGTVVAPYYTLGSRPSGYSIGANSVAEGYMTAASAYGAHAEGSSSKATGTCAHAEGMSCVASGNCSHASGYLTTADQAYQTVVGIKNKPGNTNNLFAVGIGSGKDGFTVDTSGNTVAAGSFKAGSFANFDAGYTSVVSVPAGSYVDKVISFNKIFAGIPNVVANFMSTSTAGEFGLCSCAVITGSVGTNAFAVRIFNGDASTREPRITWMAFYE